MPRVILFLFGAIVLAACGGGGADTTSAPAESSTSTSVTSISSTSTTATTTSAPTTTSTEPVAPPLDGSITVSGPEEIVFDWTTDRCDDTDIPDLPTRAFRDATGDVNVIATHFVNRRFLGPNLNEIERICDPVLVAAHDPDPATFADAEWIASTYTDDGETVYGLVHNEYHGWERGDCATVRHFNCWYNSITSVVSTNGGKTFEYMEEPPGHLVANLPYPYTPDSAAVGLFSPSNIVRANDGYYYTLAKVGANLTGNQSVCLMRTDTPDDPAAWRFWDGKRFEGVFVDPYDAEPANPEQHLCPPLAIGEIGAQMIESLTWNTHLDQWLLVGISADSIDGREVWGFYYSWSTDLINWTHRKLLIETSLPWTVGDAALDEYHLYPSLIDPDSESMSFTTTGKTAYLYFTRTNAGPMRLDRDLVRIPITIEGP